MKKFFGLTVLLVVALFTSCNFNNSSKKGAVDFVIPVGEIIALRNDIQEEAVETAEPQLSDELEVENEIEELFGFLVQIKGNNGYHQIRYESHKDTTYEVLEEETFHFSFDNLPVNQQYKVMIDIFIEERKSVSDGEDGLPYLIFSGDKDNIIVSAGETTREQVFIEPAYEMSYSNFDIVLSYKDGDTEETKTETFELDSSGNIPLVFARNEKSDNNIPTYTYYIKEKSDTEESEYNVYSGYEAQDPDDWKELVDLRFKLRDDSHYYGFDFVQHKETYNEKDGTLETEDIKLEFNNENECAVLDDLGSNDYPFDYPLYAELSINDKTVRSSVWLPYISVTTVSFAEKTTEEETFTDTQSGEITIQESRLSFTPWNVQEGKDIRYMTTVPLADILGGKHLSDGDTVVFLLEANLGDDDIFAQNKVSQFYYQLQPNDWETKYSDDTGLFENNNCINFVGQSSSEAGTSGTQTYTKYTFVMPLNQIESAQEYKSLQLFFDYPSVRELDSIAPSLELPCSIKYTIFPAEQNAFVFGVGTNYDVSTMQSLPYRYEINLPLNDSNGQMYTLTRGKTVEVTLSGNMYKYEFDEEPTLYSTLYAFDGEICDEADYVVAGDYPNNSRCYHPLSNDSSEGNVKSLELSNGHLAGGDNEKYIFSEILAPFYDASNQDAPQTVDHNYRFQCYTPCYPNDPSVLLVIKDFNIVIDVVSQ